MRRPLLRLALVAGLGLSLGACSAQYRNHGYTPSDAQLSEIVVGVDTRDSVAETVGAPTSAGILAGSDYYYVSSKVRHFGAAAPKEVERKLVAISFDDGGVVRNIETYALEDGRVVPLTRRVTNTGITDKTFLRQLLGNIGNFRPGGV
ncbi:outer membrane protein assembly factor BamE [Marinibacterium profundimaris]|uniref:SmpA/OmlA n=1 Tax=Marinibacterium profundimaris TaxID=1679460 RepID=A0A225P0N9_9RHOB|nr:outer membrane protein assembly factor BamE [Marinibacterium profundimaris]OWU77796.1 SmpA/OmlA [Marinibacterium profundimaris]